MSKEYEHYSHIAYRFVPIVKCEEDSERADPNLPPANLDDSFSLFSNEIELLK